MLELRGEPAEAERVEKLVHTVQRITSPHGDGYLLEVLPDHHRGIAFGTRAFAEADGLETKNDFRFPAKGKKGIQIDDVKPAILVSRTGRKLDSRSKTFEGLKQAADKAVNFEGIVLTVGQGNQMIALYVGEIAVDSRFLEELLLRIIDKFPTDTPVTMTFRKAHFTSGHDLKDFASKLDIELKIGDVDQ